MARLNRFQKCKMKKRIKNAIRRLRKKVKVDKINV